MKKGGFLLLVLFVTCLSGCIWLCSGAFSEAKSVTPGLHKTLTTGQAEKKVETEPSLAAIKPVLNSGGM